MLVAYCSGHLDLSLLVELETSLNQTQKVYLTLICSLMLCWVFPHPISMKSKYQNNFDESKAWPKEGLSNPNCSCFYNKAGGQQSPALVHFYPHEGDHSLTPFITASAKAQIKPLAFLMSVTHLSWSNRFVLSHWNQCWEGMGCAEDSEHLVILPGLCFATVIHVGLYCFWE